MSDEQNADATVLTTEDNVRLVLSALGMRMTQYVFRGQVDWAEVERTYGSRFGDAELFHYEGESEYDDNSYYMDGEVFVIATPDAADRIGEIVRECFLTEIRRAPREQQFQERAPITEMHSFTMANYADYCDDWLLWQHGIVFARRDNSVQANMLSPDVPFSDDEWEEIEEFLEP